MTRNLDSLSSYCCESRLEAGDKLDLLEVVSNVAFEGQNSAALLYHVSACRLINKEFLKVTTTPTPKTLSIRH